MAPTNEAIIWAACIQAAAEIHVDDLRKLRPVDQPQFLMDEATHFYHAAMDRFPMSNNVDWWMQPRKKTRVGTADRARPRASQDD